MSAAHLIAIALALLGCKSSSKGAEPAGDAKPRMLARVPVVDSSDAIGTTTDPVPLVVLVDEAGALAIAVPPPAWKDLAAFDPSGAKAVNSDGLDKLIREARMLGWTPARTVDQVGTPLDLAAVDDRPSGKATQDDPPPPDRPDSQYAMAGSEPKPDPAAERRVARARIAGSLGVRRLASLGGFPAGPNPERLADIAGELVEDHRLAATQPAVVLAHPRAKATALISAVLDSEGVIGVAHHGALTALRLQFPRARDQANFEDPPWIEVRVGTAKLEVEAVPEPPIEVAAKGGKIDAAALATAYLTVEKRHALNPLAAIDVLVAPDVDAQHLVDVLVALDRAGAHTIGLGSAPKPNSPEAALRGHSR